MKLTANQRRLLTQCQELGREALSREIASRGIETIKQLSGKGLVTCRGLTETGKKAIKESTR